MLGKRVRADHQHRTRPKRGRSRTPTSCEDITDALTLRVQAEQIANAVTPSVGHPPVIGDANKVQLFLASLADGNYRETAIKVAGMSKQTLYNTIKRAEAGDVAAMAFVDAMEKAEAQAEAEIVRNVRTASKLPQFWAAGMTLLERKNPEKWGRRQDDSSTPKVIVQIGANTSDVTVNIASLSPVPHNDLACAEPSQVEILSPINGDSVTSIDSVPEPKALPGKRTGVTRRGNRRGTRKASAGA